MLFRATRSTLASAAKTKVSEPSHIAEFQVGRYDPHGGGFRIETYKYEKHQPYMVMDLLLNMKVHFDPSLAFRNSCCEGICGSCAVNINGVNSLSCITPAEDRTVVLPLPNMPILRDLVTDFRYFFKQYELIKPYSGNVNRDRYHAQNIYERYLHKLQEQERVRPVGPTLERLLGIGAAPKQMLTDASGGLADADAMAKASVDVPLPADFVAELRAAADRIAKMNVKAPSILPTTRGDLQESFHRSFADVQLKSVVEFVLLYGLCNLCVISLPVCVWVFYIFGLNVLAFSPHLRKQSEACATMSALQ